MGKEVSLGYLGYNYQMELINQLLHPANKRFQDRIIDIIHAKYFDNEYFRLVISIIKNHYEKYEKVPTPDILESVIHLEIKDQITKDYVFEILKEVRSVEVEDWKFVQEKALNFCRQQVLKKAHGKIGTILDNGEFENFETCVEIITDAVSVGAERDDGVEITDGLEDVLEDDFRHPIPMGIEGLDDITDGGISKGELAVVLAPFGVGKSTILTKIANTAYNEGHNVLQIVFEDLPKIIQRKHISCWSGIELNELSNRKEEVLKVVGEKTKGKTNHLRIKKFPSEGTNMNTIKSYIRSELAKGIRYDVVLLDYIDCVEPVKTFKDEWSGEGNVMRAYETMAHEFDVVAWTAVQGNRGSISADVVDGSMIGGSIKKGQIGHFIISVAKTLQQKEQGLATLAVLKSRFGKDGIIYEDCTFDNGRVFINTESSSTFLGYEKNKESKDEEERKERIKRAKQLKRETDQNNTN